MKLRDIAIVNKWKRRNDGSRSLLESVLIPEVQAALAQWAKNYRGNGVLIGGLALSFWNIPRYTTDLDVLFIEHPAILSVDGFRRSRKHALVHKGTDVEVELLDPEFLKIPVNVVQKIIDTAVIQDGLRIASKSGLVASKLWRFNKYDQGDIENLIKLGGVDLSDFPIPAKERGLFDVLSRALNTQS